ncbi:type I secretion protein [Ruegeria arenilitoris]|uniref:Uncharacterized protein n=1 Tax=Ruegeria arenilitoris TaxID=1173585 RepID=A0A238KME9_9RHOB|nr:type I secretion protein [Ruegeria arenilitoris]SMX43901.1 hypothetical protein RUA8715_02300 [Ruegeria arenilitoris]
MPTYTYQLTPGETSNSVNEAHFGANFREMFPKIDAAFDMLGVTHLRYPAGQAQQENITQMVNGGLNSKLAEFLDWAVKHERPFSLSIPVGESLATQPQMNEFVRAVYDALGPNSHLLTSFEVGNEYWSFQSADSYGEDASKAVTYLKHAIDEFNETHVGVQVDPKFLVQTAPPWHVGSSTMDEKNKEIIQHFDANNDLSDGLQATVASEALDGIVSHYYYNNDHGDDNTFSHGYHELRQIGPRAEMWNEFFVQELDYNITEWNVQNSRFDQQGLKAASVVLEQFENMLIAGVDAADVWSVRNKNYNSLAGGIMEENPIHPSPAGQAFIWMRESLVGEDGRGLCLMGLEGLPAENRPVEVNAFSGDDKTVLYVSTRTNDFDVQANFDLSGLVNYPAHISVRKMGILEGSADGLSDRAAFLEDGTFVTGSRNALRKIDEAEKLAIEEKFSNILENGLFDRFYIGDNGDGTYRTYIPDPSTILLKPGKTPETATSLDDYYFATEVDVVVEVTQYFFEYLSDVQLEFDPYEVAEIVIQPLSNVGTSLPGVKGDFTISPSSENPGLSYATIDVTRENGDQYTIQADKDGRFELQPTDQNESIDLEISLSYKTDSNRIDARDALEVLRVAVGLDPTWGEPDLEFYFAADIDRDGAITANDALQILNLAVAPPEDKDFEWLFIRAGQDFSGVDRNNVTYETSSTVQVHDNTFELDMTSILLGNTFDFV